MRAQRFLAVATVAVGAWFVSPGLSADAQAACGRWQFVPPVEVVQSNATRVSMYISAGRWRATAYNARGHFYGTVQWWNDVRQPQVKFVIFWGNDSSGVYTGTIRDDNYVSGTSYDRANPLSRASWHISQQTRIPGTGVLCVALA